MRLEGNPYHLGRKGHKKRALRRRGSGLGRAVYAGFPTYCHSAFVCGIGQPPKRGAHIFSNLIGGQRFPFLRKNYWHKAHTVSMGTRHFHRLPRSIEARIAESDSRLSRPDSPHNQGGWLRRHPVRSGVRCGICDGWDSNCASGGCRPGSASLEGTDSTGCRHSDSTRFPRNSVGKRRTGSGRTGPNRWWNRYAPTLGRRPVGLGLHEPL